MNPSSKVNQILISTPNGETYDLTNAISNVTLNSGKPIEVTNGSQVERNLLLQLESQAQEIRNLQKTVIHQGNGIKNLEGMIDYLHDIDELHPVAEKALRAIMTAVKAGPN